MPLKPQAGKQYKPQPPAPMGLHPASLFAIIDIGTHVDQTWGTEKHKIILIWEFQKLTIEREDSQTGDKITQPRVISKTYNYSLHKKAALRLDIETWLGRTLTDKEADGNFELEEHLMHRAANIVIIHKTVVQDGVERIYGNINAVMPCEEEVVHTIEPVSYCIEDDGTKISEDVYPWIEELIKSSHEYQELVNPGSRTYANQSSEPTGNYDGYDEPPPPTDEDQIPF